MIQSQPISVRIARRAARQTRCVTWGRGQQLGDAFLAHVYRLLFGQRVEGSNEWKLKVPNVARAKLAVAWTIDHVRRYNTGLVGGKLQLAVLEKQGDSWIARHEDPVTVAEAAFPVNIC
jgi:hypothetical protein